MRRGWRARAGRAALLLVCTLSAACGSDSVTEATGDTDSTTEEEASESAALTIVSSPETASAIPSGNPGFEWSASFVLVMTETTGTGATVTNLAADLRQAAGGIVITPPGDLDEAFRFDVRAGTNRLEGLGTLEIELSFDYTLPNSGREALISLAVDMVDDLGARARVSLDVRVL